MENLIGFFFFFLSGLLFGLFGAGGSLITIPILTFFFDLPFKISTTYSLIVVFLVSFFGVLRSKKKDFNNIKPIIFFGISSLIGVLFSRYIFFQIIPEQILFIIFIIFLFFSGIILIIKNNQRDYERNYVQNIRYNLIFIFLQGLFIGIFTGLLGVGGGFLIVPILILFQNFNIKQAATASIFLIFLNSCLAIIIDILGNYFFINYRFLFTIILISILGFIIGKKTQNLINLKLAQKLFAFFLILISLILSFNIYIQG